MIDSEIMGLKSCRVTISDMDGNEHIVEISASTLYEAVALGLHSIRRSEWSGEIAEGINSVKVRVRDVPVEHTVKISAFQKWLSRTGGSPNEMTTRKRIQEILRAGSA